MLSFCCCLAKNQRTQTRVLATSERRKQLATQQEFESTIMAAPHSYALQTPYTGLALNPTPPRLGSENPYGGGYCRHESTPSAHDHLARDHSPSPSSSPVRHSVALPVSAGEAPLPPLPSAASQFHAPPRTYQGYGLPPVRDLSFLRYLAADIIRHLIHSLMRNENWTLHAMDYAHCIFNQHMYLDTQRLIRINHFP